MGDGAVAAARQLDLAIVETPDVIDMSYRFSTGDVLQRVERDIAAATGSRW